MRSESQNSYFVSHFFVDLTFTVLAGQDSINSHLSAGDVGQPCCLEKFLARCKIPPAPLYKRGVIATSFHGFRVSRGHVKSCLEKFLARCKIPLAPLYKRGVIATSFHGFRVSRGHVKSCLEKFLARCKISPAPLYKRGVIATSFHGFRVSRRGVRYCLNGRRTVWDDGGECGLCPYLGQARLLLPNPVGVGPLRMIFSEPPGSLPRQSRQK